MAARQADGGGRKWTATQARRVLDAWARSGQSGAAFARERGIIAQRLFWWRRRLGAGARTDCAPSPRLLPVVVREVPAAAPAAALVVTTPGGARIEVAVINAASAAWVATVLARGAGS